jgi:malonyl-CoA/methylmalonyl-CoA synthetase
MLGSHLFPRLLSAEPERIALRVAEASMAYRELAGLVTAHKERLIALGVMPGAVVALYTEPTIATLAAAVAIVQSGYVLLPLDPKLGERELEHIARDADPQVALAADPKVVSGRLGAVVTLEVSVPPRTVDEGSFRPLTAADPALLLYTSGTTGLPKGVLLSSQAIAEDLDALASAWAWTEADTVVHALPVFHVHGLVLGLFGAIRRGGALSWVPRFAVADLLQALALESGREGARAVLFAVPTMYHRIADVAEPETEEGRWARQALGGARLLVSGSAALPSREHDRIARLAGQRIVERYGMTETLITCAMRADGDRRAGVVGPPVDGVEIRLKKEADDTEIGELEVRGPTLLLGYLNRPEATAEVLSVDGWFSTGDLATLEADGAVRIVGRKATDLIKCGGYRVGAGEIESALLEHPMVSEAAVIGAPDPDLGERIVAFVVTRGPVEEAALIDHVQKLLSPHKRPRAVHRVSALPRNAMGKVQKSQLKESLRTE